MHTISGTPCADVPTNSVEHSVMSALMTVGRLMRQKFQDDSLDPSTFWLLKELAARGPLRVTELAAIAGLDASTVSRHVSQLHRSGYLERAQDPDDGRAQRVAISEHGREQLLAGLARRRDLVSHTFRGWDRTDVDHLDRLLARFVVDIQHNTAEVEQS